MSAASTARPCGALCGVSAAELGRIRSRRRRSAPPRPDTHTPGVRPGGRSRRDAPGTHAPKGVPIAQPVLDIIRKLVVPPAGRYGSPVPPHQWT